jgi:hypothetical protein
MFSRISSVGIALLCVTSGFGGSHVPVGITVGTNQHVSDNYPAIFEAARRSTVYGESARFSEFLLKPEEIQELLSIWEHAPKFTRENRIQYWLPGGPILEKLKATVLTFFKEGNGPIPRGAVSSNKSAGRWHIHGGASFQQANAGTPQNGLGLHADNSWPVEGTKWGPNHISQRVATVSTLLMKPQKGGRLCFLGSTADEQVCPERDVGLSTWFISDERNQHYVEETLNGTRLSLTMWLIEEDCTWAPCTIRRDSDGYALHKPKESSVALDEATEATTTSHKFVLLVMTLLAVIGICNVLITKLQRKSVPGLPELDTGKSV